jgi:hypothetical protein
MALLGGAVYTIVMGDRSLVKEKAVKFVLAIVLGLVRLLALGAHRGDLDQPARSIT